jgi:NADH-quinone oxidoreductase subunit G
MPHIVIDGKTYEAQASKTIIQVAYENGLDIPHFCWHPELSVSGNCRMCLVEVGMPKRLPDGSNETDSNGKPIINFFPKLQIACSTQITDGMHVRTKSDVALRTQESVMEFILINHPLDCPICDEAGQCKLQEYAFLHSNGSSRFEEAKNRNEKRVSWGPNVMYDAERCISCSRCIRFAKEVANQDVLSFVQRGDKVTIKKFEGTEFDNPYSMNVIDICPVGALTSKDFRFSSRVWDMSFNNSICPGCSKGCNIKIGVRNNEILRLEPDTNPYVNKFWMCDYGRLTQYQSVNLNRVTNPIVKKDNNLVTVSWKEAVDEAVSLLSRFKPDEIMFIGSPNSTVEDNFALSQFARKVIKSDNVDIISRIDDIFKDDFLKTNDRSPNSDGAKLAGMIPGHHSVSIKSLTEKIRYDGIKAIYSIDDELELVPELAEVIDNLEVLILHARNHSSYIKYASVVFPSSTFAEIEGTFVNIDKRVQHFKPAIVTYENQRFMGMKMSRLDKFGALNDRWSQHELRNSRQDWRIIQQVANQMNAGWKYSESSDVFLDVSKSLKPFNGMNYELLDEYQGLKLDKALSPDAKVRNYESHYMKPN